MMTPTTTKTIPRKESSDNEDLRFIVEVDGQCPLCGKSLITTKNGRTFKQFQIAHIYPHSPTDEQREALKGLERLGSNSESFENRIALCRDSHAIQDFHTTAEDYLNLVGIKKKLLLHSEAMTLLSLEYIGEQIDEVLQSLTSVSIDKLGELELHAVCVDKKIEEDLLLLNKVKGYVVSYFRYVQECFQALECKRKLRFEVIASKMKTSYLVLEEAGRSQEEIYSALVEWLYNHSKKKHNIACEIIVAFFVQNCEVFHEITE